MTPRTLRQPWRTAAQIDARRASRRRRLRAWLVNTFAWIVLAAACLLVGSGMVGGIGGGR